MRLVDKDYGAFDGNNIHETWITRGLTVTLESSIDHLSFRNYSDLIKKMDSYSSIGAVDLYNKKKYINPFLPLAHGCWMFFKTYFIEAGCLYGFDGFVISMTNAGGSFLKYAKHLELKKYNENNSMVQK